MANIKSQIKRNRQNDKRRLRNRVYRGEARIAVREARTNIEDIAPESKTALLEAISSLDKAAEQGVIHKNNAARRKSRLMKAYNKMGPVKAIAEPAELEPGLEAEPAISSSRGKKKSAPGRTAAKKKVSEPKAKAAVEPKAEAKTSTVKGKATAKKPVASSSKAKKPAASSSARAKKPAAKSSSSGRKKTTAKKD